MARIFDNIDQDFLGSFRATMQVSKRSDVLGGYLNLSMHHSKKSWAVIQCVDELVSDALQLLALEADYIGSRDIKYRLGISTDTNDD